MELLILLLTAVIPAMVLVYFIYRKDKYEKEPASQLLKGFGFGALSAIVATVFSSMLCMMGFFPMKPDTVEGSIMLALFGAAIPEELAKFFFLWLLLRNNKFFNEYVDGMVYAVCVGMGFAAFENIGYMLAYPESWASIGLLRALFPIPGHFFFAITMGYFYSNAVFGDPSKRKQNYWLAVLISILLHFLFDALLMVSDVLGGVISLLTLFLGLFIFMARKSKRRFEDHLARDEHYRSSGSYTQNEQG